VAAIVEMNAKLCTNSEKARSLDLLLLLLLFYFLHLILPDSITFFFALRDDIKLLSFLLSVLLHFTSNKLNRPELFYKAS